ncbi:MAG: hypothetical protein H0S79_07565 [Anaerolineaceae bacterium]|nr:hypothetical protein [Anaerolineaceae bacterium]
MRNAFFKLASLFIVSLLILTACDLPLGQTSGMDENVAQTMVALAFTQTTIAEAAQTEEPAPAETETPMETVAAEETEAVVEETEAPTEVSHSITPGEPGWIYKWFYDTDASKNANAGYVTGGDDFVANLYERPFTESEMVYRPDIDINKTEISSDNTFYYVAITLHGQHPDGGLQGIYGVEIDADRDGRGDLLVIADRPTSAAWDIAGVSAQTDANHDVGGATIMRPDSGYSGDGYENVVFSMDVLNDPDAAWARVNLGSPPSVTLAFKKSLISGYSTFVWGVWAADSLLDPAMIDLHDHFTAAEAGSPYQAHATYPLAALNLVDNTCRETYGFDATSPIPGLCAQPEPTPMPTNNPTQSPNYGAITGRVFYDGNGNGSWDSTESAFNYGVIVTLHEGSCGNSAIGSSSGNSFTFTNLPAGPYCVKAVADGYINTTPTEVNVTITPGGSIYIEFGFFYFG